MDRFQTVDPATGKPGRAYDAHTAAEAHAAAAAARAAFEAWRRTRFAVRATRPYPHQAHEPDIDIAAE